MGRGARAQRPNEASEAMARGARLKQTVATASVHAHGEKYSDEALAQKAGVSVNTVRNLWQGRNAEISTLLGVATASGMSVLDLFTAMQGLEVVAQPPALERIATALERLLDEGVQALPPQRRAADKAALEAWGGEERRRLQTPPPRPTAARRRRGS